MGLTRREMAAARLRYNRDRAHVLWRRLTFQCAHCPQRWGGPHKMDCRRLPAKPRDYVAITWREHHQPLNVRFAFHLFRNTSREFDGFIQFGSRSWHFVGWVRGWAETLRIMIFDRELYNQLKEPFDPDDFEEVSRPE